jgi:SAM-dependent MidA family methyltransferase
MPAPAVRNPLAAWLAERIRERGRIPFCDYMGACLYDPEHGYYSKPEARRFADYYTSVDVHPIFGRLLARQFREMWDALGRPDPFWLVECGAGVGRLATHILDFSVRYLTDWYAALRYVGVEASASRREALLRAFERHAVAGRASAAAELPEEIPNGCIFSNELLDALPVHRVALENGDLREVYVTLRGGEFVEQLGPLSTAEIAEYFGEQGIALLEGQQAEAGLAACRWIESAGRRLSRGFVLTVDYGREARELYDEHHMRGTLLAYAGHRAGEDFYRAPGEQDLTAHVNFTALDLWGRRAGLARTGLATQSHFLLALGRGNGFADLYDEAATGTDKLRARLLFKNLVHPEGMGETFAVFVQHKGIENPRLAGLDPP